MGAAPQYKLTASFNFWEEIEGLTTEGEMSEAGKGEAAKQMLFHGFSRQILNYRFVLFLWVALLFFTFFPTMSFGATFGHFCLF